MDYLEIKTDKHIMHASLTASFNISRFLDWYFTFVDQFHQTGS